ncbi:MAG TPA: carboxypeptidase regulatory-like domain-containing protein [Pyrinomonadaceae bacterium]|nr:carboxypeptidase regulatory-like domain-containing protein [Pyrinomonadaceae bacterium]
MGQVASATLSGSVTDQAGAVVPGATVTVLNLETALKRQAITSSEGYFTVPLLPPGTYSLKAQGQGFAPIEVENVVLNVGDQKSLQIQLKAGDISVNVQVDSTAAAVKTDGAVSTVVDKQFVEKIPMNGRSFQSLILLTPGVTTNTPQVTALLGNNGEFSVNGQRTESNIYTVDGVSANNGVYIYGYSAPGAGAGLPTATTIGTTQSLISLDALQEFRVSSSSYAAEYGHSPGGQFSFISKAGTNKFHGSAFEYLRNDEFDANDWFNNSLRVARPAELQNDFGVTVGGPIMLLRFANDGRRTWFDGRNRTFFFFSYEGLRLRQPLAASLVYVPSLALRQRAPAVLQGVLNAYPLPTGATHDNGLAEYLMSDSLPSKLNSTSIRIDHNFSSSVRMFFRFSDTPSDSVTRAVTYYETKRFSPRSYTFGLSAAVTDALINDFHFGYSQNKGGVEDKLAGVDGAKPVDLFQAFGVDRTAHPTAYLFVGLYFSGSLNGVTESKVAQRQNQWNVSDVVDYARGSHHLKAGVDYLQTGSDLGRTDPYSYALFDSSAAVIANNSFMAQFIRYFDTHPIYKNIALFGQDEWRVTPRLNISLGLRWEVAPAPSVSRGSLPRVVTGSFTQPSTLALAADGTPFYETTYNNFAPRFGASYLVSNASEHETVIRGGVGVFYDSGQNIRAGAFDANPGVTAYKSYTNVSFPLTPTQTNVTLADTLIPPFPLLYAFGDPTTPFKLPYTIQYNLTAEQTFGKAGVLSIAYVGARGRRLVEWDTRNVRTFNPTFQLITFTRNGLTSDYDGLQIQFQRRLRCGLQILSHYTWSHALDYGSTNRSMPVLRGNSDFDLRHNVSAAITYEIPIVFKKGWANAAFSNWSIDGRFTARSSFPITLAGNTLIDAVGQQYQSGVDLVAGVPIYIEDPAFPGGRRVNPVAFKLPATGKLGNAPRNFVRGFGAKQVDMVLRRNFPLSEQVRLQLGWEVFNLFNHPNFGFINTTSGNSQFGLATKMLSSSLGGLSALYQQGGARSMQGNVRLTF